MTDSIMFNTEVTEFRGDQASIAECGRPTAVLCTLSLGHCWVEPEVSNLFADAPAALPHRNPGGRCFVNAAATTKRRLPLTIQRRGTRRSTVPEFLSLSQNRLREARRSRVTSNPYDQIKESLRRQPATWLVTGCAGFIGSHLLETLLGLGQQVLGLDNFSSGRRENLADVAASVGPHAWARFRLIEGDIVSLRDCAAACSNVDFVLHQAAMGSVPRSIEDPIGAHRNNVDGFLNILVASRDAKIRRVVYASSSAIYGNDASLPIVEASVGRPLSPYAATKQMNEIYAGVFYRNYGLPTVGLRYFNVFGPRQDPNGAYAAVIPKWFESLLGGAPVFINGDGGTTRDFCYVADVVQANLLAATCPNSAIAGRAFNVAGGSRTTLDELFCAIRACAAEFIPSAASREPQRRPERAGDVRHSHADIQLARDLLHYGPAYSLTAGLQLTARWYGARQAPL